MNQVYKSLWNASTGAYVAAPESAVAAGQQVSSARTARRTLERAPTQRLALEPRIVFDGALPVAAMDVMETTIPLADTDIAHAPIASEHTQNATDDVKPVESLTVDPAKVTDVVSTPEREVIDGTLALANLSSNEIIFIDAMVNDLEGYITDHPNADVVLIDSSQDGVEQMAAVLAGRTDIDAIHLLSHGAAGQFSLGNTLVDLQSITGGHADALAVIKAALSSDADILIYGCDVAAGVTGQAFVDALAKATGADVAASVNTTGAKNLGGDWLLETHTSTIETETLALYDWQGKLLTFADTDGDGIHNINDLDDDNDGILDATEGLVIRSPITTADPTAGGVTVNQGAFNTTYTENVTNITLYTANGGGIPFGATAGNIQGFDLGVVTGGGTVHPQLTTVFSPAVSDLIFSIGDLDLNEVIVLQVYDKNGVLIDDITPYIVYTSNSVTSGSATQSALITTTNTTSSATFSPNAHIDFYLEGIEVSRVISTTIGGTVGSAELYFISASTARDTDSDGVADYLDLDNDNDGISDVYESTGGTGDALADTNLNGTVSLAESIAAGATGDGDIDDDGLMDMFDANTADTTSAASLGNTPINSDSDTLADYLDLDSDNDGIADTVEARLSAGYVANDGNVTNNDADKDGVIDLFDSNDSTTQLFGGTFVNPVNTDATFPNADTTPDYRDTDSDGDGLLDSAESGLTAATTDANNDGIRDSVGASYADPDGMVNNPQTALANQFGTTAEVAYREYNRVPTAVTDNVSMPEDGTLTLTPLTGDTDPDGDTLTVTSINGTTLMPGVAQVITVPNGTVSVTAAGVISFTPTLNYVGSSTFAYTISDGKGGTTTANQVITITAVNDAPVNTVSIAQTTPEDTTIVFSSANGNAIQISDVDVGASPVTVTIWAEHGLLTLSGTTGLTFSTTTSNTVASTGSNEATIRITGTIANINAALNGLSFAPTANNNGAGKITLRTEDNGNTGTGGNLSDTDSVVIDFTPVKDTVVDSVSTSEDMPVTISPLVNDSFGAGNVFLTSISSPTNGTAVLNPGTGTTTYTPNLNFNGTDSYTYTSTTIDHGFNYEYYAINPTESGSYAGVFPTGFPSTSADGTGWTEGISVNDGHRIQEQQNDTDQTLIARWSGVVLIEQAGNYTFNITVDNAARLVIDGVTVIADANYVTSGNATIALAAGVHTFHLQYGELNANDAISMTYSGLDTGNVAVNVNNDKHWGSAARIETDTINILVNPVNDAPVATPISRTGNEDTPIPVSLTGTDIDGTVVSVTVTTLPLASQGTLTLADGTPVVAGVALTPAQAAGLIFNPAPHYHGAATVAFTVTDNQGAVSTPANADITINPVNDPPVATPLSTTGAEDSPIPVGLTGSDIDGTVTSVTVNSLPSAAQGILTKADGTPVMAGVPLTPAEAAGLVFVPAPDFNGTVTPISFSVTDNQGSISSPAVVNITVTALNDPPVAIAGSVNTLEDTSAPVSLTGTDVDGTVVNVTVTTLPLASQGTLFLADGTTPVVAGSPLTPAQAASLIFTPALNYNGVVNIPFTVTDNAGATATPANFTIDVAGVDDDPVATPVVLSTPEDTPTAVTLTGADVEGPITGVTVINLPPATQGVLTKADGTPVIAGVPLTPAEAAGLIFNPAPNFNGAVNIPFTVTDSVGQVSSPPATLTLNVTPVNDPPVATTISATTPEDTPVPVSLTGSDIDGSVVSVTVSTLPLASQGTLTLADGTPVVAGVALTPAQAASLVFVPAPNYSGPVTTVFTVTDNQGAVSLPANANMIVNQVNDPPVATPLSTSGAEDTPIPVSLTGSDIDGTVASITVNNLPSAAQGVLSKADGTPVVVGVPLTPAEAAGLVFVPALHFNGVVTPISFTVIDNEGSISTSAAANITVTPANDAPVAVDDVISTNQDTPLVLNLLGNDTDVDGDTLTLHSINGTLITPGVAQSIAVPNGTVTVSAAVVVTFTPAPNYNGPAVFNYDVQDTSGATATGMVTVNVVPVANTVVDDTVLFEQLLPQPIRFGEIHWPSEYALETRGLPVGMPHDLFVAHSVRESHNQIAKNSALGVWNTDTPTANQLNSFTFDLNGLPVGMDPNLFVQHAVRGVPVTTEHNLYVQNAVRQSQLESAARNIGVTSFNTATSGVVSVLSPFELGSPLSPIDLSVDGVQGEFAQTSKLDAPVNDVKTDVPTLVNPRAEIDRMIADTQVAERTLERSVIDSRVQNTTLVASQKTNQQLAAASFTSQLHHASHQLKPSAFSIKH